MKLLLIDTCGASGSVALAEGLMVVATEALPGRSASERLVPAVRALLAGRGWALGGLAAIVVVHGPGSFTGVRVGVSAAKGLSEAVGVPLVAMSRLAVLAALSGVLPFVEAARDGAPGVLAALDAGRGEFYLRDAMALEALVTLEELVAAVGDGELVVCEERVASSLRGSLKVRVAREPEAWDAVGIAVERVRAGSFDDAATLDANYLRRNEGLFGVAAR